ncbi:hypothetical protein [Leifsonia sp. NPDC058248]|uniref:hypothetical protein n=1 Tax=Leifsonia sp. NPDC058248 TaxID=3346402 RepID=UPI0036D868D0
MSDLRVDASRLRDASTKIIGAVARVPFASSLTAPGGAGAGAVGSRVVTAELRTGTAQQAVRARLSADALTRVGATPAVTAQTFVNTDAALARVF